MRYAVLSATVCQVSADARAVGTVQTDKRSTAIKLAGLEPSRLITDREDMPSDGMSENEVGWARAGSLPLAVLSASWCVFEADVPRVTGMSL